LYRIRVTASSYRSKMAAAFGDPLAVTSFEFRRYLPKEKFIYWAIVQHCGVVCMILSSVVSTNKKHLKNVGPICHCEPPHAACFTLPFTRCRYCRTPPAHRCPQQHRQQRQRVTEGTAMAPWNGPNYCRVTDRQHIARYACALHPCRAVTINLMSDFILDQEHRHAVGRDRAVRRARRHKLQ